MFAFPWPWQIVIVVFVIAGIAVLFTVLGRDGPTRQTPRAMASAADRDPHRAAASGGCPRWLRRAGNRVTDVRPAPTGPTSLPLRGIGIQAWDTAAWYRAGLLPGPPGLAGA